MSVPTDGDHSAAATRAEEALRALAAAALGAAVPALLVRVDGSLLAANAAGRALFAGAPIADAFVTATARLAQTLRPDRPPRLERVRLPGRLTPATFACSLLASAGTRALLMVSAETPSVAAAAPPPAPASAEMPARAAAAGRTSPVPAPPETSPSPLRFTWRTDLHARLTHVDPRLAHALDLTAEAIAGRDWHSLGAGPAHHAVSEGRSFTHLPVRLPTARGEVLDVELGGAPIRGEGMRGFGIVRNRQAEPSGSVSSARTAPQSAMPIAPQPPRGTARAAAPVLPVPPVPAGPAVEPPAVATPRAPQVPAPEAPAVEPPLAEPPASGLPASGAFGSEPSGAEFPGVELPGPPPSGTEAFSGDFASSVRVTLSIVPTAPNVVPLRAGVESAPARESARSSWEGLSSGELNAFREIARALGARLEGLDDTHDTGGSPRIAEPHAPPPAAPEPAIPAAPAPPAAVPSIIEPASPARATSPEPDGLRRALAEGERPVLDRLPVGLVAFRDDRLLYVNRALLDWTGHIGLEAIEAAGGLATLFGTPPASDGADGRALTLLTASGLPLAVEARLLSTPWEGGPAMLYVLRRAEPADDERLRQAELALREAEGAARELRAILDTATDGVVLIDAKGVVLSMNHPAEALFGFAAREVKGENFTLLFAPESQRGAVDYLDGLASNGVASVLNDGREVIGRVREGGLIPLFMTIGRVGEDASKFCAVLRDITQWKRAEEELTEAKRLAERANLAKSDFLAKISHEIRTPLNAIIGFSEVMMEERFGPIENQRYRDYLRDIHASGGHLVSLINDLLDLSKIEAGKLDLSFTSVPLNEIVQQCMGIMQPQANRERIIIRSSLASDLPPVVADARSIRQIVLNLVSNSIKFTRPGGQVILSTALTDAGEVVMRVRDTGIGMSEADISVAMEPFRQLATSGSAGSGGTGLGLPLTKALAEANRASFNIRSAVDVGTIVEITFPSTRVLAE
ncbi:PAS domain S-box-containing protein [Angulomicrobium tetraedrale]|uniref:histidine kinase n=1 Tax=Ancylobacter tetraedralis TaxID=217068 RepID=A0A839Z6K8_9HYPH|nr:ATP-binding protein [Ancylobacter tetraedralis]MBB3769718.1 PAS domain S-box-containing protein [Ancylobacter tetraedralis]